MPTSRLRIVLSNLSLLSILKRQGLQLLHQVLLAAQRLLSLAQRLKAVQQKLHHQPQNKVDEKRISKYNKTGEN